MKAEEEVIGKIPPTEEYHLEGVDPTVREIYNSIKHSLIEFKPSLKINPKKYCISIIDRKNFAFIYIRKKRINIVVMIPENIIRDSIEHHQIVSLTPKVQKFYGGECATIVIENKSNLDEVINLLKSSIK